MPTAQLGILALQQHAGNAATQSLITRTLAATALSPEDALIRQHSSMGGINLRERELGRALSAQLPAGQAFVCRVLDRLASHNRDDVALEIALAASDQQLTSLAADGGGRGFLNRLAKELEDGFTSGAEKVQIERLTRFATGASE
jgi:hypothetical protein